MKKLFRKIKYLFIKKPELVKVVGYEIVKCNFTVPVGYLPTRICIIDEVGSKYPIKKKKSLFKRLIKNLKIWNT